MRLGINVPNDLLDRVKSVRPEVNISQVCREALEQTASRHEFVMMWIESDEDDLEEEANRLAALEDPSLVEPDWLALALEDAREWIKGEHPKHWERILDDYSSYEKYGKRFLATYHGRFHERLHENWQWVQRQHFVIRNPNVYDECRQVYEESWLSYVFEVRRRCLELIDSKRAEIMREREVSLRARPAPEVPPHLLES